MQKFYDTIINDKGRPVEGARIVVTQNGVPATLYAHDGVTVLVDLQTDADGYFEFRAADGEYTLEAYVRGIRFFRREGIELASGNAELAGVTGAASVGTASGESVQAALDSLQLADYGALRAYAGNRKAAYITGYLVSAAPSGIAGLFTRDDSDTTTLDNNGTVIVDADGGRWKRVFDDAVNVEWFGADKFGVIDSTAAIRAAAAHVQTTNARLVMDGIFKIAIPQGESLVSLVGTKGIKIDAARATLNNSSVSYTADALTPIILLNGCEDTEIHIGEYIGYTLPDPAAHLGYRGATLVRAINATKRTKVRAKVTNARYGVQTGEYGDASKGQCAGFDIDITGSMIGYPFSGYYFDDIDLRVEVDGFHRAAYLAGCKRGNVVARWKNQYIADTVVLLTDCLTSGTDAAAQADPVGAATTSRGCSDIDAISVDLGSAQYTTSTRCAGITLSRVDACEFKNIRARVQSKGSDSNSPVTGGFIVASAAKSIWNRYAYNWEPSIVLDNIEVSGVIDHSAVTGGGNSGSEFYVVTYDGTTAHAATVRNFRVDGFTFLPSLGHTRPMYFHAPGLANEAIFSGYYTPGVGLSCFTNSIVPTLFIGSKGGALDVSSVSGGSMVVMGHGASFDSEVCNVDINNTKTTGGVIGGAGAEIRQREKVLPLTGASVSWANAILNGEMVLGVQGYVQQAITGATGYQVGVAADATRYANTNTIAQGSVIGPANAAVTETAPRLYQATTPIVVTAKTANFTGGTIRLVVTYLKFTAPTQ